MNSLIGTAGLPHTVSPAGHVAHQAALGGDPGPVPICKWPASPPCPPTMTKSPSLVLPEMPT